MRKFPSYPSFFSFPFSGLKKKGRKEKGKRKKVDAQLAQPFFFTAIPLSTPLARPNPENLPLRSSSSSVKRTHGSIVLSSLRARSQTLAPRAIRTWELLRYPLLSTLLSWLFGFMCDTGRRVLFPSFQRTRTWGHLVAWAPIWMSWSTSVLVIAGEASTSWFNTNEIHFSMIHTL